MAEPEDTLRNSPVDFDSAVAYALHPEMRRLLLMYVVGGLFVSFGLNYSLTGDGPTGIVFLQDLVGIGIAIVGGILLFGGLVGAAFKLVADANILAESQASGGS